VQSLDGNKVTDSFRMLFMVASVRARYAPLTGACTQPVATANILFLCTSCVQNACFRREWVCYKSKLWCYNKRDT